MKPDKQTGITLIELMIAQTLALVVIGGALSLIAPAISLAEQQRASASVQETGRLVMEALTHDIAGAGFGGCGGPDQRTSIINTGDANLSNRLQRWAYTPFRNRIIRAGDNAEVDQWMGDDWNTRRFRKDEHWYGDLLMIQSPAPGEAELVAHFPEQQQFLVTGDQRRRFQRGALVEVSDCIQSVLLQINSSAEPSFDPDQDVTRISYDSDHSANCPLVALERDRSGHINPAEPVASSSCSADHERPGYRFRPGSRIWSINSHLYYLGIQPGTSYPSLYRTGNAVNASRVNTEVVAEGVENLRFLAGFDADGDGAPDRYGQGRQLANEEITSIRIWAQVTSLDGRGRGVRSSDVGFPDEDGMLTDCAPRSHPVANCPPVGDYGASREVFFREVQLRNAT